MTGPDCTEAYAAVEKASASRRSLYAPSILEHAARLLTTLWSAGEQHGITPDDWKRTTDLAGGTLDVVARPYEYESTLTPERTVEQIISLQGHLVAALKELGITARLGDAGVIVGRGPDTPPGGYHGDADIDVRIHSDGGWAFAAAAPYASVMPIVAPASEAGASEVAGIVAAFVRGELGNVLRR
ncbi:hypothetical protein [Streptomyces yaizuensis]|uniref:Uncharacterized protein n=1 Tax=Streptomyces yaizuensis TaxID=2989713 RepID=A0AA86IXT8_9ACTN|nr:hypothetical protein [Streptomyces sp. YSPA8]BDT39470.1 hypothetical protein SYYSPA8_36760 [Streptomyces sp. YSPA8]